MRWSSFIWTFACALSLILVIVKYEGKGVLTSKQKDIYNFITTGLIVILGLSFYVRVKLTVVLVDSHFNHRKPSRGLLRLFPSSTGSTRHRTSKASTAC